MSVRTGLSGPLLLLAVTLGFAAPLRAGIIYNNFPAPPNENTYDSLPMLVGRQTKSTYAILGAPFTPAADNEFAWVRLAAFNIGPAGPNDYTITLRADNGGLPGAVLESISNIALPSYTTTMPSTFHSTVNTLLKAGVQYWVVLDRTSAATSNRTYGMWYYAAGESQGKHAALSSSTYGAWEKFNSSMSLEVGGLRDDVTATPEPAAWSLGAGGMLALLSVARMRRKRPETR